MPLTDDRLSIGSIIFEFVTDTHPPKDKYYIIIGFTNDKIALGTVFVNSVINPNLFRTQYLRDLHIPLLQSEYPFLKYDSFIDCSNIQERPYANVRECINGINNKYGYIGSVDLLKMDEILKTLDNAHTIPVNIKRKFGLR